MTFIQHVGRGYGDLWQGVILDVEYKPLDDIKVKGERLIASTGGRFNKAKSDYCWVWPTGECLKLRAAKNVEAAKNFLGHEYSYIGFNELTKWQTSEVYDHMLATIRAAELRKKGIKPMVFNTTNPYGAGAIWVKDRYIDKTPYGHINREEIEIDVGYGKTQMVTKSKVAIPGSFIENPFYTPEDVANLLETCEDRPELYEAWVKGSWDAPYLDGALGSIWKRSIHVLEDFKIPPGWYLSRALDWGHVTPFSIGWFAESNGEEFEINGERRCYPRGTVIQFAEWYGSRRIGKNKGLELTPAQIAHGIRTREHNFVAKGVITAGSPIRPGPADNQIANNERGDIESIKDTFWKHGVAWTQSDKTKGSRILGLQAIRDGLTNARNKEGAGLYFFNSCQAAIKLLPTLQREGEDIASDQEDHCYDMLRYRLVQRQKGGHRVTIRY